MCLRNYHEGVAEVTNSAFYSNHGTAVGPIATSVFMMICICTVSLFFSKGSVYFAISRKSTVGDILPLGEPH